MAQGFVEAKRNASLQKPTRAKIRFSKRLRVTKNLRSGTLRMKPLRERIGKIMKHHKRKADLRVRDDGITAMLWSAHAYLFKRRPRRASGSLRGTHPKLVRRRRPTCAGLQARCSRYRGSIENSCCAYIDWPIRCGATYWVSTNPFNSRIASTSWCTAHFLVTPYAM